MAKIIVYGTKIVTDTNNKLCVASEGVTPPPPPPPTSPFVFDSATRTITGYSSEGPKDVVIPETIDEVPVEHIGDSAFDNMGLTSLNMANSVVTLGASAFSNNPAMTTAFVSNQLQVVGADCFAYSGLSSLHVNGSADILPATVTQIGEGAFRQCQLTAFAIPPAVTIIPAGCFRDTPLAYVVFLNPDSVSSIESNAFNGCSLTYLQIPDSVVSIEQSAFYGNAALTSITFGGSLVSIGAEAFFGTGINEIVFPASLQTIYNMAFAATNLTRIEIGAGVNIDSALNTMGANIGFRDAYINNGSAAAAYTYENSAWGVEGSGGAYTPEEYFTFSGGQIWGYSASGPKDVVIPPTIGGVPVTGIATYGMAEKDLTSVVIPDSVTAIGDGAFQYNQLTALIIPDSVTSIGAQAFYSNSIATLHIGIGVETIGSHAFAENALTSLTIPNNVVSIDNACFYGNYSLTTVTLSDSMTTIPESAFGETAIQSITMNSITVIEDSAFSNAPLTSVTLGADVSIGSSFPTMGVNTGFRDAYIAAGSTAGTYIYNESAFPQAQWEKL